MSGRMTLNSRSCGVLLHITSLPGPFENGDIGPSAELFIDFLAHSKQHWWQFLPITTTDDTNSPYRPTSSIAGNPLLISLERLVADHLLTRNEIRLPRRTILNKVNFASAKTFRFDRLRLAFERFCEQAQDQSATYQRFMKQHKAWLDDYALFAALSDTYGSNDWLGWPTEFKDREPDALAEYRQTNADDIAFHQFLQFTFFKQWDQLREYAQKRNVGLIGDVPIFVVHASADVWASRSLFDLDKDGNPKTLTGVPPDYFSKSGQLWEHPHYHWVEHEKVGFTWWRRRFREADKLFDAIRVDHFLGFVRLWAIPASAKTAKQGKWIRTPGKALLTAIQRSVPKLDIIAEDLGLLTREASSLRDTFHLPGMRILQYAFDKDDYHRPHAYPHHCVAYTGTHDNDTSMHWLAELRKAARTRRRSETAMAYRRLRTYSAANSHVGHWDLVRLLYTSPANTVIVPMADLLGLGEDARMNRPGTQAGNWTWRLTRRQLSHRLENRLKELTDVSSRCC